MIVQVIRMTPLPTWDFLKLEPRKNSKLTPPIAEHVGTLRRTATFMKLLTCTNPNSMIKHQKPGTEHQPNLNINIGKSEYIRFYDEHYKGLKCEVILIFTMIN